MHVKRLLDQGHIHPQHLKPPAGRDCSILQGPSIVFLGLVGWNPGKNEPKRHLENQHDRGPEDRKLTQNGSEELYSRETPLLKKGTPSPKSSPHLPRAQACRTRQCSLDFEATHRDAFPQPDQVLQQGVLRGHHQHTQDAVGHCFCVEIFT